MPSPFPTLCNQCPSLRAKINELEGRISNLYSIREDEILIDSLAAASRIMEATDLESSAPCFPPAADRDRGTELGAKPKSPACSTPIVSAPWSTVPTGRRRGRRTGRPLPREKLSLENRYQVLDELSRPEQATPSQPRSRGSAVPVSAVHRGTMHPPVTAHSLGASQPLNGAWTRPSRSIVREKPPRVPPTGPPTTLVVGSSMVRHLNFFSAETLKTKVSSEGEDKQNNVERKVENPDRLCPLHNKPHPLRKFRGFCSKTLEERKAYLKEKHVCFKCCASTTHLAKDCDKYVLCTRCNSNRHPSALHPEPAVWKPVSSAIREDQGGEQQEDGTLEVMSKCTEVCGDSFGSRSCSKICLVRVYPAGHREKAVKAYAVLDEQSNRSLAKTELFDLFDIESGAAPYTLKTCSGVVETSGRHTNNLIVESIDGNVQIPLPTLIECDMMPDDRLEIPSAEIAHHYPHLKPVMDKIPAIDHDAAILLLLGRDILCVHKVRKQYNGPKNAPYAQQLDLTIH
ncbi:hypothetical protein SKAU_G00094770 [Synaphobranchus kaupii]|uniref:Uncharacterized protein n=1 Tax=Synaphobranchus kaupii TaxID=118154 RepID=A0A9Q1FXY9_SYNKA|nr:hypothetical protein SKAU_G00094770 [Synaphobranchus kaupii]